VAFGAVELFKAWIVASMVAPWFGVENACRSMYLSLALMFLIVAAALLAVRPYRRPVDNVMSALFAVLTAVLALAVSFDLATIDRPLVFTISLWVAAFSIASGVFHFAVEKRLQKRLMSSEAPPPPARQLVSRECDDAPVEIGDARMMVMKPARSDINNTVNALELSGLVATAPTAERGVGASSTGDLAPTDCDAAGPCRGINDADAGEGCAVYSASIKFVADSFSHSTLSRKGESAVKKSSSSGLAEVDRGDSSPVRSQHSTLPCAVLVDWDWADDDDDD
jgi:hypothetical protein